MKYTILTLALLATIGAADASKQYQTNKQTTTTTASQVQQVEGTDVLTQVLSLESARSPALVVGRCLGSMSLGMANNGWSFSFGASRRIRDCEMRELAVIMIMVGGQEEELGRQLLRDLFNTIQRKHKVRYTCRRPVAEHCTTGAGVEVER